MISRNTCGVTPLPEPDVRAELDRVLASRGFSAAGRMSKLLRYCVEKTLAGETDQLKEYSVGVEVFDRDDKYDPRLDSIVRVEAGRLRSRLDEYYNGEGAASPIRISLPKGGYSAQFEPRILLLQVLVQLGKAVHHLVCAIVEVLQWHVEAAFAKDAHDADAREILLRFDER